MICRHGGEWTTVRAVDELLAAALLELGRTAELLQQLKRDFEALVAFTSLCSVQVRAGELTADFAHARAKRLWSKPCRNCSDEVIEEKAVGFRKNMFGFGGEGVGDVWFASPGASPALLNEAVTLEAEQVGSNRIIGQMQSDGEFVNGAMLVAQEGKDAPAGGSEQAPVPGSWLHTTFCHSLKLFRFIREMKEQQIRQLVKKSSELLQPSVCALT